MSFFPNAQNTPIYIQDSSLTAVSGVQQNNGPVTIAAQHISGNQNIYQAATVQGGFLLLQLVHSTI